jgi:isocitrate/isopropylmalate dehydrogenase
MMLEHLGERAAADRITAVVLEVGRSLAEGSEQLTTSQIGDLVARKV